MSATITSTAIDAHVYIDSIQVLNRHRKDLGDLSSLMASIEDLGLLLNPITLTRDSRLIAGQRRLEACRQLGWDSVPVRFVDSATDAAKLLRAERDENTERKEMTVSERMSLAASIEELERPKALARKGARTDLHNPGLSEPEVLNKGRVDEIVAPAVGMSVATYKRAKCVQRIAVDPAEDPGVREAAVAALADMETTGNVSGNYAKVREAQARNRAHKEAQEVKAAALADPPSEPVEGELDPAWIPAGRDSGPAAVKQRRGLIAYHAGRGLSSRQIAEVVLIGDNTVREIARRYDIAIPADALVGRQRRIDSNRVVRETVYALEGSAMGVQLANLNALDPAEIDGWVSSMTDSLRALNRFVKLLKEKTREA